jgi:3-hydroxy-5-methyl-1-naphthoate 3-O-methyltransferase
MTARFGLTSRFGFLAGDLLEVEFPDRCDVATLGHILHSEGERRSQALLKKVNNALKPGGTIAIAEFTPNSDRTGPPQSLIFAINMLVNTDEGDTYPFEQVVSWLEEAGFVNARELPSAGPAPLILANRGSI